MHFHFWCTEYRNVVTKTAHVGEDVTLTCTHQSSLSSSGLLVWVRVVAGNFPEVLGATFTFYSASVTTLPRITTKKEPGTFVLSIKRTTRTDTALYYCEQHADLNTIFLQTTFLYVKEPESHITAIIQDPVSDPLHPGDSKTLQCSVFYNFEKKTCPGDPSVYWFRTGSDTSHPTIFYTHGNRSEECEMRSETHSLKNCTYGLNKIISSSDSGTYYCAVAACGDIFLGNGAKVHVKGNVFCLSSVIILAISLIVIAFLIYAVKDQSDFDITTSFHHINTDLLCFLFISIYVNASLQLLPSRKILQ
uniref:Ig-like domain-containing protein n=1 Tax=Sphaeramia orbicularis TaxID=375764 RepID=A0A672ZNQ5_9TELE